METPGLSDRLPRNWERQGSSCARQRAQTPPKQSCCQSGSCSTGSFEGKDGDGRGAACSKKAIWDCSVASPGFAELLDELVLRMEVFPFSACFYYFLLFRFWPWLPKGILSF